MTVKFPVRMNLVDIEISSLNKIDTLMDIDFLEPVGSKKYNTGGSITKVKGQVNRIRTEAQRGAMTGDISESDGHLVFRTSELDSKGITFQKGDKVIKIASEVVDYKIVQIRKESFLRGAPLLTYVFFSENWEKSESIT